MGVDPAKSVIVQTIPVRRNPNDVALDPPTRTAYVPNTDDGSVSVLNLDSRSVTQTIPVGARPSAATVDSDAHTV